jgi:hypothetical protein
LSNLVVADHPLIVHKLSLMCDKGTSSMQFPPSAARGVAAVGL